MTRHTDEEALAASQLALRGSGATGSPSLLDALIRLGRVILELREQLEAARRERDAVADLMDDDLDAAVYAAASEECHGEVPGA